MSAIGRRTLLLRAGALALGGAALAAGLASCGRSASGGTAVTGDDVVLGRPDAPVTLIEYASSTCGHCAAFHAEAFERLKTNYIDTGRVKYVFREFPTNPPSVAVAGFQVARCGGATSEQYIARVGELFRTQESLFNTLRAGGDGRQYFVDIGSAAGLSEEQVMACIRDGEGARRVRRVVEAGQRDFGVDGTPTFIINGRKAENIGNYETLARALDAALAG